MPSDHLRLLGPDVLAEIDRLIADVPPPSPELVNEILRPVLAPAAERQRARMAAAAAA